MVERVRLYSMQHQLSLEEPLHVAGKPGPALAGKSTRTSQPGASVAVRIGFSMELWREASSHSGGCVTKKVKGQEVEAAD